MANRIKRIEKEQKVLNCKNQDRDLLRDAEAREPHALKEKVLGVLFSAEKYETETEEEQVLDRLCRHVQDLCSVSGYATSGVNPPMTWPTFLRRVISHPKILPNNIYEYRGFICWLGQTKAIRPIDSWKSPRSKNPQAVAKSLVKHLYVQYQMPDCLLNEVAMNFHQIDFTGLELFFHVASGEGVHTAEDIPLAAQLNGKGNFFFHHAPSHFDYEKALKWAFYMQCGFTPALAGTMAESDWYEKTLGISMANELKGFLLRNPEITPQQAKAVTKFYRQQCLGIDLPKFKIGTGLSAGSFNIPALFPEYSLKGRSLRTVLKHIEAWNRYTKHIRNAGGFITFPEQIANNHVGKGPNGEHIKIVYINNSVLLFEEGYDMRHCVGEYYQGNCINGEYFVFSIRMYLTPKKFKRLATISINRYRFIDEFRGKANSQPGAVAVFAFKEWAKNENIYPDGINY